MEKKQVRLHWFPFAKFDSVGPCHKAMGLRRHVTPVALTLVFLILAREIYPYATPANEVLVDGYEIEEIANGLGGPTCMEWDELENLLMCDRDGDRIILFNTSDNFSQTTILDGLNNPHGIHITPDFLFLSEAGTLSKYDRAPNWQISNRTVLIEDVPTGNHQTVSPILAPPLISPSPFFCIELTSHSVTYAVDVVRQRLISFGHGGHGRSPLQ